MAKKPPTASTRRSKISDTDRLPDRPVKGKIKPEEALKKAFDPLKNLHLWTMWRSAVNGKIVDEAKSFNEQDFREHPLGKSLTNVPLKRLIKYEKGSKEIAESMMNPTKQTNTLSNFQSGHRKSFGRSERSAQSGTGYLGTKEFVYFGVPRVVLKK
ncbi:uncharacterized protein LOC124275468 [Haliotis rubra]|uniref:uncharacterized protein LOC124275468 n=1 Tax=Haliotis rubra TaxID=36100 RepID=UPI001EE6257C|nr:uncharacterized protein LOC124275468 [Haliotis rubra]XP_046567001.1 uncharacterized protein LOC124275468 [Haliotis rubra]